VAQKKYIEYLDLLPAEITYAGWGYKDRKWISPTIVESLVKDGLAEIKGKKIVTKVKRLERIQGA